MRAIMIHDYALSSVLASKTMFHIFTKRTIQLVLAGTNIPIAVKTVYRRYSQGVFFSQVLLL
jgi:hypothetical protein